MTTLLKRLLASPRPLRVVPRHFRFPPGRCSCHEPTVKWCTRHGKPLSKAVKAA